MSEIPKGGTAVMARRVEPPNSLDFFPTPPWATRALTRIVLPDLTPMGEARSWSVWEPACGEGHMAEVLAETFGTVHASDIHDYGRGYAVADYTGAMFGATRLGEVDFIITNPPFNHAVEFAERALGQARRGVALLVRTAWLEGGERHERLFAPHPPTLVAVFSERVPMARGRWDPKGSTATSYAWVVWWRPEITRVTRLMWIPPGQRVALTREDDVQRFGGGKGK